MQAARARHDHTGRPSLTDHVAPLHTHGSDTRRRGALSLLRKTSQTLLAGRTTAPRKGELA
jgi:hypothetical protein